MSKKELTETQQRVMCMANGGWTFYAYPLGCIVYANGERLCDRRTIGVLLRKGLIKQIDKNSWRAVDRNGERMNDIQQGYTVCDCKKFAFLLNSEVIRRLPRDYDGELCATCNMWVCAVEKIETGQTDNEQAVKAENHD